MACEIRTGRANERASERKTERGHLNTNTSSINNSMGFFVALCNVQVTCIRAVSECQLSEEWKWEDDGYRLASHTQHFISFSTVYICFS